MSNDTQEPMFLPQGIADPDGRTGFFAADAVAIDAIGLADGLLLWRAEAVLRPLIASGHLLAAQANLGTSNELRIVLMDVDRHGEPVLTSEPVVLPEWVDARSRDPEVFLCRARLQAQTLSLEWQAQGRYSGGAPPPRQVVRQAGQGASGAVRMDLETGRIEASAAQPSEASMGVALLRESDSPPSSPDIVWQTEPWRAGNRSATLAMKEESSGLSLHLETRSVGGSPKQVELARGLGIAPALSPDGRYVLVEPDEPEPGPRGRQRPWWIFETATGRRIATVPHEEGAREPCIVGPRLFYLVREPERPAPGETVRTVIRARDLGSGELLWERLLGPPRTARAPELPRGTGPSDR